jgi:hypothetical protein
MRKKFSCVSLFLFLASQYSWNKKYNLTDMCLGSLRENKHWQYYCSAVNSEQMSFE